MVSKKWIIAGLVVASVFWSYSGKEVQGENLPVFSEPDSTIRESLPEPLGEWEFPYVLRNTGLIAEYLAQYEGPFLEDDVQEPVSGVAALMVYNPGNQYVESVQIALHCGQRELRFSLSHLPPRSRVLVLENSGQPFTEESVTDCSWDAIQYLQQEDRDEICVTEEAGKLVTANRSSGEYASVTLYYKQYSSDGDFFVGGRTYSYSIEMLHAGEERAVVPYRYVTGYSRIVAIICEKKK